MRKPEVRKGRQCIFPEVPRTHTFGAYGASNGMFFSEHLDNMVINSQHMDWREKVRRPGEGTWQEGTARFPITRRVGIWVCRWEVLARSLDNMDHHFSINQFTHTGILCSVGQTLSA